MSLVYFFAVWEKLRGETWNDGTAISYAFRIEDLERFQFRRSSPTRSYS